MLNKEDMWSEEYAGRTSWVRPVYSTMVVLGLAIFGIGPLFRFESLGLLGH